MVEEPEPARAQRTSVARAISIAEPDMAAFPAFDRKVRHFCVGEIAVYWRVQHRLEGVRGNVSEPQIVPDMKVAWIHRTVMLYDEILPA